MHGTLVAFAALRHRPEWQRWRELANAAPPFLTPEFFALAAGFAPDKPALVGEAWEDDVMVGVLPLVRDGDRLLGLRCDYSPGYDYRGTPDGIAAIWEALRADPSWSELVLGRVPAESLLATRLLALAGAAGCPVIVRRDQAHPYFALPGFEARLSAKFKTNLQRCARKAGGIELERIPVPDRTAFEESLAIEAMAWKGAAGTSIESDARAAHLYRALAMLVGRRGRGALYFLRAHGRRIATLLAVEDGHTLYALKIGYDPSVANLGPGHLLVWMVAADAEARGLAALDFVGRDDEWKRKWTDQMREHVTLVIYRDDARGLARYAMNLLRPHLPEHLRDGFGSPLPRGCQRADILGAHALLAKVRGRLDQGLGIKSGIARALRRAVPREQLGATSAFPPGSWVRVKSTSELRELLDEHDKTRGLAFTGSQWQTTGKVYRVVQHVRRLRDDHGRFRPVSRTVLLEGVDCGGTGSELAGCGRHCPMMYRDEWLEAAGAPARGATPARTVRRARVRDLDEILAGLDLHGRRDGLTFMPEMRAYAGKRFVVASRLTRVFEYDRWIETRAAIYMLEGLHCTGAVVGERGPCERACALMWHEDWLMVDPEAAA